MAEDTPGPGDRNELGQFIGSGNPNGQRLPVVFRQMLKSGAPLAAQRIIEALSAEVVVHYQGVEVGSYVDHRTRLAAAEALFNRIYGRPLQPVSDAEGQPLAVTVNLSALLVRLAGG